MTRKILLIIIIVGLLVSGSCNSKKRTAITLDNEIFTVLDKIVGEMDEKVDGAIEASYTVATKAETIFKLKKNYGVASIDKNIYFRDKVGILSDHGNKMESNIYVSHDTPLNSYTTWYIKASEEMIPVWKENLRKYPYLGWQYLTETKYTSNRFFPWSETTMAMGPNVKWREFGFYKVVMPENDPKRELRFGRVGADILGLGLLSSISIPIYINNEFVAVSSVDFLITQTFGDYLYKGYPGKNSYLMLVNRKTYQVILRNEKNKGERGWDVTFNCTYLNKCMEENAEGLGVLVNIVNKDVGKIEVMAPNKKNIYFKKLKNVDWVAAIVTETYAN